MENRLALIVGLCGALCCLIPAPAAAQEKASASGQASEVQQDAVAPEPAHDGSEKKNYFLKETEEGIVLVQRLSWEALDDIYGFEFELEQQDKKTRDWSSIDKQIVQTNYMDVSLPPGKYRYRVRVINLLEQREEASAYRNFDIRFAYQPEISSVSPDVINFDELEEQTVTVNGKNFHEDTSFSLQNRLTGAVMHGRLLEVNEEGTRAVVEFEFEKANTGTYTFKAVDPSDLLAEQPGIVFRYQKPLDIFLSGGYFFNGFLGNTVLKTYFNTNIAPVGGGVRLTVVPIKRYYGNFGFNFTGSGTYLRHKTEGYTVKTGFLFTQLNAAYFLPIIKHRLVFDVHVGTGALFMLGTQFVYNTAEKLTSNKAWFWGLTLNAGTALYIYVYKKLYIEVNLDHIIPIRGGRGFPKYIIQPQIGMGWEF